MDQIKHAKNEHPILDIFKHRWSARAFSNKSITIDILKSLIEAARWSPSANNEQPWHFVYSIRGNEGFQKIWDCLMPGNKPWAQNAAALIVTIAHKKFEANGNHNPFALHDLGMATSNLLHQAIGYSLYTHPMAGFDKVKLVELLSIGADDIPACIVAVGYLDKPETLEEPFKTREITERTRKPLTELLTEFNGVSSATVIDLK